MECVASEDPAGLKEAIQEVLPEAAWQRCYVHFSPQCSGLPAKAMRYLNMDGLAEQKKKQMRRIDAAA